MNMPAMKTEPAAASGRAHAVIGRRDDAEAAAARRQIHQDGEGNRGARGAAADRDRAADAVLELVCRRAGSTLPPPSRVFKDTKELIFDPFFDRGGIDRACSGISPPASSARARLFAGVGRRHRARHAGRPIGVAMQLDPLFQVLRTFRRWPGCRCRSPRFATASPRRSS